MDRYPDRYDEGYLRCAERKVEEIRSRALERARKTVPSATYVVDSRSMDDYYLKMMIAGYFATALAKQYEKTVPYLEQRRLDDWVHKKAIQKALESYRVPGAHKEYLKSLR